MPPTGPPTACPARTSWWNSSGRVRHWKTGSAGRIHAFATNERLARAAAFCGYKIGFTTESGVARLGGDPLQLPRIEVKGDWTLETFAGALEKTR